MKLSHGWNYILIQELMKIKLSFFGFSYYSRFIFIIALIRKLPFIDSNQIS